jgi:phage tail sheath protein FI
MDPTVHVIEDSSSVVITNGVGYIDEPAVLDTIVIAAKEQGVDYKAEYTTDGRVKLTALEGKVLVTPSVATYDKMDITAILDADIIGGNTDGERTGVSVVELIYQTYNMIPTIFAAPGWSQKPTIKEALVEKASKINGHWDAIVVADLDSTVTITIALAKAWKVTNGYTDVRAKVGWPKAKSAGKEFYMSTLIVVRMQQTDFSNDNVPSVSPSNKQVDAVGTILADGTDISFDEVDANVLNAAGITTLNFRSGIWVLWGPHNSNYEYGAEIDPKDVFDASIRTMMYLTNGFQERYMSDVDGPLNRSIVGTILNDSQTWLNSLIADGHFLHGQISFVETSNPTSSIVEGNFIFDIATTTTPVAKSLTFVVQYTTAGIATLFGGES